MINHETKITCFEDLVTAAKNKRCVIAVVCAEEETTLSGVVYAAREGVTDAIFLGNAAKIRALLASFGESASSYKIVDAQSKHDALEKAVELVKSGEATALMKGGIETGDFIKAVLARENNLRGSGLLSTIGFYETKHYHKLLAVTDFALNISPDLDAKHKIIDNAVALLHRLGIDTPKVSVLAETEHLNEKIPASVDAAALKKLWQAGEIKDCILEGPVSFDLAVNKKAAEIKGFDSPVAGDTDLMLVPDIVSGNILVKSLTELGGALTAGTVLGAKIPVIMTSRSARAQDKFYSIALAVVAAEEA